MTLVGGFTRQRGRRHRAALNALKVAHIAILHHTFVRRSVLQRVAIAYARTMQARQLELQRVIDSILELTANIEVIAVVERIVKIER